MGSLSGMIKFLNKNSENLKSITDKLDKIQEYFNNNFSNVNQVRNSEIESLQKEYFKKPGNFPKEINRVYNEQLKKQENLFETNINNLAIERNKMMNRMNKADSDRLGLFMKIKRSNTKLDAQEEKIKNRILVLEKSIVEYNSKIDELNSGFGFLINIFSMRKIQTEKNKLLDKRDALVVDIESTRTKWERSSDSMSEEEKNFLVEWNNAKIDLSLLTEKIGNLKKNRDEIIKKAAFSSMLAELKGDEKYIKPGAEARSGEKCPRCESENKNNIFFCYYCGERFSEDRPDITGSLAEVGELNSVYDNLLSGVKHSVSFLALMDGIKKGLEVFTKSVESVKDSQDSYSSLSTLKIDIPGFTKKFSENISKLSSGIDVKFFNLHPQDFSDSFKEYEEEIFTDKNIESFFTKMGNELNRTTKEQWG